MRLRFEIVSHAGLVRIQNEDMAYAGGQTVRDDSDAFEFDIPEDGMEFGAVVCDGLGGREGGEKSLGTRLQSVRHFRRGAPRRSGTERCDHETKAVDSDRQRRHHGRKPRKRHGHNTHRPATLFRPGIHTQLRRLTHLPSALRQLPPAHARPPPNATGSTTRLLRPTSCTTASAFRKHSST